MSGKKTAIITGASGGIGAGLVEGFLGEGYNVVATSRDASQKLTSSGSLVLVEGDIGKQQTAASAVEAAIDNFGTIDVLVNNAGIFLTRPFTDFTTEDFEALVSVNLLGFLYITQRTVKPSYRSSSHTYSMQAEASSAWWKALQKQPRMSFRVSRVGSRISFRKGRFWRSSATLCPLWVSL